MSDLVILFLIAALAIIIRNFIPVIIPAYPAFSKDISYAWWFFPVWISILAYEGAYTKRFPLWDEVKLIWKVAFFSTLAILSVVFIGKFGETVSRTVVVLIGLLSLALFPPLRIAVKRRLTASGLLKRRVLILGANETGRVALNALMGEPNMGYDVIGFLDDRPRSSGGTLNGYRVHHGLDRVERYLAACDIHDVVIALPDRDKDQLNTLVTRLQHKAASVLYFPDYSGIAVIGTEIRHFFHDQAFALEIKNNLAEPLNASTKKAFDFLVGILLFLVLAVPLAVIALLIRATSPGPAIYRQARSGKNGMMFSCYKFRTMYRDADARLKEILATDGKAREEWEKFRKLTDDPRITPLGRFLRGTSLDELPQIMNVLRGEMSLVGPRPVTGEEIEKYYRDRAELCFSVLPGITGLWQVSGRSNTSYDYRISLDAWYVRNWNLWLDVVILLKTVYVVVKKEGAK
ncbi:MAG: undecaprenyl-phosphate galactose phosphotransferase WbaP [Nitrospirota bacterium]